MPTLSCGRHIGVSADNIKHFLTHENDETVTALIVGFRLNVDQPERLMPYLLVVEFPDNHGEPKLNQPKSLGYMVSEVLNGKAGWPEQDVSEFNNWLQEKVQHQLQETWDEIHQMIIQHPVWKSDLWRDD